MGGEANMLAIAMFGSTQRVAFVLERTRFSFGGRRTYSTVRSNRHSPPRNFGLSTSAAFATPKRETKREDRRAIVRNTGDRFKTDCKTIGDLKEGDCAR